MARPKKESKQVETGKFVRIMYRYLAHPTDRQIYRMENWLSSLYHLSNESVAERKETYRTTGKELTFN